MLAIFLIQIFLPPKKPYNSCSKSFFGRDNKLGAYKYIMETFF